MAVGVASPSGGGRDSAANGGGLREEGAAPAEEGLLGMQVEGKRVAAAEIAVEGEEEEEMEDEDGDEEEEGEEEMEDGDEEEEKEMEDEDDDEEEEEEEEEQQMEDDSEDEEKWVGQYCSTHSILLVGDGDFSFSLALATGFGSGANLVATSLDTYEDLGKKYSKAESNITGLKNLGATVLHGIDVKTMKLHTDLKKRRFDRIVYNFPYSGFKGKECKTRMINLHKKLMRKFFSNACCLLRPYGEIHVSHSGNCYKNWDLQGLAAEDSLLLVEKVGFQEADYPGYHRKTGDGPDCDKPFLISTCFTFKFKIGGLEKQKKPKRRAGAISSVGGDTRSCHPRPLVQPYSGPQFVQFVPGAYTARVPMTLPPHVIDQRQQRVMPLNFDGIPRATFIYRAPRVQCSARQCHQSSLMNALGTAGSIPSPVGRTSSASLPASQGLPRYEERINAESQGNTDYFFASEYQRSLLREYWMQRQLMPEGTSLNYSAFLEARQWESVQRQERLRRMIAYGSQ